MRTFTIIAALLAATSAMPASATTSIVLAPLSAGDPNAVPACTGTANGLTDRVCNNGNYIGRDFGSTAELGVLFSTTGPGVLVQQSFGIVTPGMYVSGVGNGLMTLTPASGIEVRLVGFDQRAGSATGPLVPTYALTDLNTNAVVWSYVAGSPGFPFQYNDVSSGWFTGPLQLSWENAGAGTLVVSNFGIEVRGIPSGAVPEPASWAMMVGGFGLIGGAVRRRRQATAITAG